MKTNALNMRHDCQLTSKIFVKTMILHGLTEPGIVISQSLSLSVISTTINNSRHPHCSPSLPSAWKQSSCSRPDDSSQPHDGMFQCLQRARAPLCHFCILARSDYCWMMPLCIHVRSHAFVWRQACGRAKELVCSLSISRSGPRPRRAHHCLWVVDNTRDQGSLKQGTLSSLCELLLWRNIIGRKNASLLQEEVGGYSRASQGFTTSARLKWTWKNKRDRQKKIYQEMGSLVKADVRGRLSWSFSSHACCVE